MSIAHCSSIVCKHIEKNEMDLLQLIGSSSESEDEDSDNQNAENGDNKSNKGRKREEEESKEENRGKKKKQASITILAASKAPSYLFKRTISHRQGHWAGHIMIPVKSFSPSFICGSIQEFQHKLQHHGYSGIVVEHDETHLSLSKHFSLQISNLEPFVRHLKKRLEKERPTKLYVNTSGNILVNDERTRSFWGWNVQANTGLRRILSHIDSVLQQYNQPPYYENPIFHISLASIAENVGHLNNSNIEMPDQSESDSTHTSDDECYANDNTIVVDRVVCKFGNKKTFEIML